MGPAAAGSPAEAAGPLAAGPTGPPAAELPVGAPGPPVMGPVAAGRPLSCFGSVMRGRRDRWRGLRLHGLWGGLRRSLPLHRSGPRPAAAGTGCGATGSGTAGGGAATDGAAAWTSMVLGAAASQAAPRSSPTLLLTSLGIHSAGDQLVCRHARFTTLPALQDFRRRYLVVVGKMASQNLKPLSIRHKNLQNQNNP